MSSRATSLYFEDPFEDPVEDIPTLPDSNDNGCFARLMSLVYRDDDDTDERVRKSLLFPLGIFLAVIYTILFIANTMIVSVFDGLFNSGVRVLILFCFLANILKTRRAPVWVAEVTIIAIGFTLFIADDLLYFGAFDSWTGAVIMMDMLLLTGCRNNIATFACGFVAVYLVVKTIEEAYRLGIYDLIPEREHSPEAAKGTRWMYTVMLMRVLIFVTDYVLTKRFAMGMRKEQQKSLDDVEMANLVADALVKFDLDTAAYHLGRASSSSLRSAFESLIGNLRLYRPYLPDALFVEDEATSAFPTRGNPPGISTGDTMDASVTIVFTDIQSSTDIWERHTTAMRVAMDLHNAVMRELIYKHNGYEVKTIGDAFMVAFDTAVEGVRFALEVQQKLVVQNWPVSLLEHPLCRVGGGGCWRGLRVRIGVHTGHARLEINPVTSRADYMGPTVNKAARVEAAAVGGGVGVTDEVLEQLGDMVAVGSPFVMDIGEQEMKGMGRVQVQLLLPMKLREREQEIEKTVRGRKKLLRSGSASSATMSKQLATPTTTTFMKSMTRNKLSSASGTIVTTRVSFSRLKEFPAAADAVASVVTTVLDAMNRHDGLVVTFCGDYVIGGWNLSKGCTQHAYQSGKYVAHVKGALEGTQWDGMVTVGVHRGAILHGMVGTAKQRFVAVIGRAIDVSKTLADGASLLGVFCLMAGDTEEAVREPVLLPHLREVAFWGEGTTKVRIYQLNLETFALLQGVWGIFDGAVPETWSASYHDAYAAGDTAELQRLASTDPSIAGIVEAMQGLLSLPVPLCCRTDRRCPTSPTTPEDWLRTESTLSHPLGNNLNIVENSTLEQSVHPLVP